MALGQHRIEYEVIEGWEQMGRQARRCLHRRSRGAGRGGEAHGAIETGGIPEIPPPRGVRTS